MKTDAFTIVRTVADVRACVRAWRHADLSVGLVPTMGALHDGHMALVRRALSTCDRVIVTLFVNPTQFAPSEDFAAYPRDEAADAALLQAEGAHVLFAPSVAEMYLDGETTQVRVAGLDTVWEGAHRPGHFTAVATVVAKLFNVAQADHAFFGEKDYQQLRVIAHMAEDLCVATEVHGVATVRAADGVALSSRNAYLSDEERATAPVLYATLTQMAADFREGGEGPALESQARDRLTAAGFVVDYVAIVNADTLAPLSAYDAATPARVLVAAKLGRTRLIDNIPIA